MSDRASGNPHLADSASRGLPIVAAPPVRADLPAPHPADVGRAAQAFGKAGAVAGSTGWSPTAWQAGAWRSGRES